MTKTATVVEVPEVKFDIKEIERVVTSITNGKFTNHSLTDSLAGSDVVVEELVGFLVLGVQKAQETGNTEHAMVSALGSVFQLGIEVGVKLGRTDGTN